MCHQLRLLCHTAIFHFGKIIISAFKFCIQFSLSLANKICVCVKHLPSQLTLHLVLCIKKAKSL